MTELTLTSACRFCGESFNHSKPTTTMCRSCYYDGRHHGERFKVVLDALKALPTVKDAYIYHTGGGCFGLQVDFPDGRLAFATVAFQEPQGSGNWTTDPSLPDEQEPHWALGLYANDDDFGAGESTSYTLPLTDDQLVAAVKDVEPYCDFCHTSGHDVLDCEDIDPEQREIEVTRRYGKGEI